MYIYPRTIRICALRFVYVLLSSVSSCISNYDKILPSSLEISEYAPKMKEYPVVERVCFSAEVMY